MECAWRARRWGCVTIRPRKSWATRRDQRSRRCARPQSGSGRTDIVRTWLLIAAERRELEGLLKRFGAASKLPWDNAKFAREANWKGDRWWMVANGPGSKLV